MHIGRILVTAVVGFFLFLFLALDLLLFGVVAFDSALMTLLPMLGLVLGGFGGALAGKRHQRS